MRAPGQHFDAKAFVARGYDGCGADYTAARGTAAPPWLALLTARLEDGAAVLDIGCGGGTPVTSSLAARFAVTGVDVSQGQIERARRSVQHATFLHGDIMDQVFETGTFAGVVMIYTLFHLPRDEQPTLLRRIHSWLRPGGLALVTFAQSSAPDYIDDDFYGASMYWSHHGEAEYDSILRQSGFEIIERTSVGHGYTDAVHAAEVHPLVLVSKPESSTQS